MPRLVHITPSYRRHRSSGQAVVTLNGIDHYLGPWKSKASRVEYERLVGEWLANGRQLPLRDSPASLVIAELIARYWRHAKSYYRKNGSPTSELSSIREALRPLKRLYGRTRGADFGPLALKTLQRDMIGSGWSRNTINNRISRIKRMFKWAAENELVPSSVHHGLQAVSGLRRGRSDARETEPVKPVADELVDATLPHVSSVVSAMIQLQRLTGMRSGELTIMRGCDLDTSGKVWLYTPATHKTEHHGHERPIYLGPRAQAIVRPFLKPETTAFLFSPVESEVERTARAHQRRKTPLCYGNRPGLRRKRNPKRRPRDHYTTDSYRRAITRACDKAFPPPDGLTDDELMQWRNEHRWHPHQLRHSAATRLRKEFGIEAARVVLGHRSAAITELYAEIDGAKAAEIMARVG
ncbi:MAG: tyrosine-type recombinase/integrase [Planctomycetota bacterium]